MLEVVDLACERGERRLFNNLNFALQTGELLYVHGANGSGKTTLLRTLCGLALPAAGEVRWNGAEIRRLGDEYHDRMMYIGHLNGIKDELTAFENLRVSGRMRGVAADEERAWMRCIAWNSMPAPNCRARRCRRGSGGASPWPGCCWTTAPCGYWMSPSTPSMSNRWGGC